MTEVERVEYEVGTHGIWVGELQREMIQYLTRKGYYVRTLGRNTDRMGGVWWDVEVTIKDRR